MIRRFAVAIALTLSVMMILLPGGGTRISRPPELEAATLGSGAPGLRMPGTEPGAMRSRFRVDDPPPPPKSDSTHHGPFSADDSLQALAKLSNEITAILNLPSEVKAGKVGVEVRSLTTDKLLFAMNADKPLTPASTTKLVTSFTALSELGPNYVVRTVVTADVRPAHDGIVKGNLYVKGFGDPFLSVNEIDALIDQLVDAGIHQVDGNIVGDGSFFDDKTERIQYSGDKEVVEALPPIAALTISQGVFSVVVSSPRTPGEPCNVQTFPHSSGFTIINNAVAATPRTPARKGSARRGKRHADLLLPLPATNGMDATTQRYGDAWPPADEPLVSQKKPAKKAAPATASKAGAKHADKSPAAKSKTVAAKTTAGKSKTTKAAPVKNTAAKGAKAKSVPAKSVAAKKSTAKSVHTKSVATKASAPKEKIARAKKPATAATSTVASKTAEKEQPAQSRGALKVSVSTGENGQQIITINGSLPPNRTVSYRYQMKNPPLVIAGMVYDRLRAHGITIAGKPASGIAPVKGRVIAETGRPLVEILHLVMKNSNNFLAEYVFKMIGAAAGGQEETAQKSVEKIQHRMTICHVPFGKCVINDGSGLSRANCISASALAGILDAAYNDHKVFDALYPVMSIAGVDGTLRGRMKGTYAEGNVHGKTGTLNNVSALVGYVTTRDGEFLCFSMLMNGHGNYHAVQDRVAAKLAAFSYSEALAAPTK